jgi:hypothetical protein
VRGAAAAAADFGQDDQTLNGKRYVRPFFLPNAVSEAAYVRWLRRKCTAHVRRDRKRAAHVITGEAYRGKMHDAVVASNGRDHYTGELLDWHLIGTYCNESSKAGRSEYKATMALLPTIDHVLLENGEWDVVVCAWRTNDAKNDLSHSEFIDLCRMMISQHESR